MYHSNQRQIKAKISQISRSRDQYDTEFHQLQIFIHTKCSTGDNTSNGNRNSSLPIQKVRTQFSVRIESMKGLIKYNKDTLNSLRYKCGKLPETARKESDLQRIESLEQYFQELNRKVTSEIKKGEEIICARERWQLIGNGVNGGYQIQQQESSLLHSEKLAKESTQSARTVLNSLSQQGNKLSEAREKMSSVLRNINFAGNILQMVRTRSREDNKLIAMLAIGLVFEIIFCLLIVRPWLRGQ